MKHLASNHERWTVFNKVIYFQGCFVVIKFPHSSAWSCAAPRRFTYWSGSLQQSLANRWISSREQNEENVSIWIECRLRFKINWIWIHQVHATFSISNQSPPVRRFSKWRSKRCLSWNIFEIKVFLMLINYLPPANTIKQKTVVSFIVEPPSHKMYWSSYHWILLFLYLDEVLNNEIVINVSNDWQGKVRFLFLM